MFFKDFDFSEFRGMRVFLDVDGVLVPEGEETLAPAEAHALAELSHEATEIFLVSNHGVARLPELAEEFGIEAVVSECRKPNRCVVAHLPAPKGEEMVIGNRVLTDGLFASRIGAAFVRATHLARGDESAFQKFSYFVDDIAWFLVQALSGLFASTFWSFLHLLRPRHWLKNLLIFVPALFAGTLFVPGTLSALTFAFVAFSAIASIGYIVNDIVDRGRDAKHPTKRFRPLAAGKLGVASGMGAIVILVFVALYAVGQAPEITVWVAAYLTLSYLYTLLLKHTPFIELMVVPFFYIIRILGGVFVAGVLLSEWVLTITFFGALFVTIGKRYAESLHKHPRFAVSVYPRDLLHALNAVSAGMVVVLYTLYVLLVTEVPALIVTVPVVIIGVFLQLFSVYRSVREDPELSLWSNISILTTILFWIVIVLALLY